MIFLLQQLPELTFVCLFKNFKERNITCQISKDVTCHEDLSIEESMIFNWTMQ